MFASQRLALSKQKGKYIKNESKHEQNTTMNCSGTTENNTQIFYYFLLNMPECCISCIMQHHKELNEIS